MIEWYTSKDLSIYFNDTPLVSVRYALPSDTDSEIWSKKKFPFINKRDLEVRIFNHKKERVHGFTIPKGYCFDGMTIPRFAWSLIGVSKENNGGLIASMVHDFLTEHKELIMNDRALSTDVFNALLCVGQINPLRRFIMKNSVAMFQTLFCHWEK